MQVDSQQSVGLMRHKPVMQPHAAQDIDSPAAQALAADFIAGKGMLFQNGNPPACARQKQRTETPGRAGANNDRIVHG